jgi:S1-C subfamily serine protease
MRNSDKIYLAIFFFLVLASFLNVAVNRVRFDRILTTQVMLDEKSVTEIPTMAEKEIRKRATINVPEVTKRRVGIYSGTAFHVNKGIWLTARHVVDSCNAIYISNVNDKNNFEPKLIKKVFIHPNSDMAAFKFSSDQNFFTPPNFDNKKYKSFLRQTAISFGFPAGQPGNVKLKYFGKAALENDNFKIVEPIFVWSVMQKTPKNLMSVGGLSGGPLLNNQVELIGLMIAEQVRRGTVSTANLQSINWIMEALYKEAESKYDFLAQEKLTNFDNEEDSFSKSNAIVKVLCRS